METRSKRMATFKDWNSPSLYRPMALAHSGFYRVQANIVICYACSLTLALPLENEEVPLDEVHKQRSPTCPHMSPTSQQTRAAAATNFSIQESQPSLPSREERQTFHHPPKPKEAWAEQQKEFRSLPHTMNTSSAQTLPQKPIPEWAGKRNMPDKALMDLMQDETIRLESFFDFPNINSQTVTPKNLAAAGLFYKGLNDSVICFSCGGGIAKWEATDIPADEHLRLYPKCAFIRKLKGEPPSLSSPPGSLQNFPPGSLQSMPPGSLQSMPPGSLQGFPPASLQSMPPSVSSPSPSYSETSQGAPPLLNALRASPVPSSEPQNTSNQPRYPNYAQESARLQSFRRWPISSIQAPQALAKAGFFYSDSKDIVNCFHCGGALHAWQPEDIPWQEHSKYYPDCTYVLENKDQWSHLAPGSTTTPSGQQSVNPPTSPTPSSARSTTSDPEIEDLRMRYQAMQESRMCKICFERECDTTFTPCGHIVCCSQCAIVVNECPICRKPIQGKVRVYLS